MSEFHFYIKWRKILRPAFSAMLVVLLHACAIFVLVHFSAVTKSFDVSSTRSINIVNVALPKPEAESIPIKDLTFSDVLQPRAIHLVIPEAPEYYLRDAPSLDSAVSLPVSLEESTIFDPRLRRRVSNSRPKTEIYNSEDWVNVFGAQMVNIGDGKCLKELPKNNSGPNPGSHWAIKCGKNQSEKMADSLRQALEARKAK